MLSVYLGFSIDGFWDFNSVLEFFWIFLGVFYMDLSSFMDSGFWSEADFCSILLRQLGECGGGNAMIFFLLVKTFWTYSSPKI